MTAVFQRGDVVIWKGRATEVVEERGMMVWLRAGEEAVIVPVAALIDANRAPAGGVARKTSLLEEKPS